jgi:hypothetical protein
MIVWHHSMLYHPWSNSRWLKIPNVCTESGDEPCSSFMLDLVNYHDDRDTAAGQTYESKISVRRLMSFLSRSSGKIDEELGCRLDAGHQLMVASSGAGDIK